MIVRSLDEARRLELPVRLRPAGPRGAGMIWDGFVIRRPEELPNAVARCLTVARGHGIEVTDAPPARQP
jgi:hypothetical protein